MRGPLALAAIAGLALGSGGCPCTEIGCGPATFLWTADVPGTVAHGPLYELEVTACRNDACYVGSLAMPELTPGATAIVVLDDPRTPATEAPVSMTLRRTVPFGAYEVQLSWREPPTADRDRFRVELTDPGGAIVMGLAEEEVAYERSRPNGDFCPPECVSAGRIGNTLP